MLPMLADSSALFSFQHSQVIFLKLGWYNLTGLINFKQGNLFRKALLQIGLISTP